MENHRLKDWPVTYDIDLFNKIYHEVQPLKKKLVSQMDPRRFRVDRTIIDSWFDDKILFVYRKHHEEMDPDVLKGYVINSLKTFQLRALRKAYTQDMLFHTSIAPLEGEDELINRIPDKVDSGENPLLDEATSYLKKKLSSDAFFVLSIELNPPPYIITRIPKSTAKIPSHLIAEYIGMPDEQKSIRHINKLRKEIKAVTKMAREYFNNLATS